jgi:pilus assembly protein FimV
MGARLGAAMMALVATSVGAAELGDITPQSYIGQPLAADIELGSLDPDEKGSLQVRPAPLDVYELANVAMNPALKNVSMSIVRRNQRLYVHVASQRPIDAGHVHLFLELVSPKGSAVRAATVWLAPNPLPPAPLPASAPAPLAAALPEKPAPMVALAPPPARPEPRTAPKPEAGQHIGAERQKLPSKVDSKVDNKADIKVEARIGSKAGPASDRGSVHAPGPAHEVQAAVGKLSTKAEPRPDPKPAPEAEHRPEPKQERHPAAAGKLAEVHRSEVLPAPMLSAQAAQSKPLKSCTGPDASADQECNALDRKNAALTAKLAELEGKIQALQKALAPPAAGSTAAAPAPPSSPAKIIPQAAQAQKEAKPAVPPAPAPQAATPAPQAATPAPLAVLIPKPAGPQPRVPLKPKPLVPLKPLKQRPPAPPEQSEGMSPRLLLGGGTALFLLLIGTCVHLVSRFRKKAALVRQKAGTTPHQPPAAGAEAGEAAAPDQDAPGQETPQGKPAA